MKDSTKGEIKEPETSKDTRRKAVTEDPLHDPADNHEDTTLEEVDGALQYQHNMTSTTFRGKNDLH
jgi:hypothetical protein